MLCNSCLNKQTSANRKQCMVDLFELITVLIVLYEERVPVISCKDNNLLLKLGFISWLVVVNLKFKSRLS